MILLKSKFCIMGQNELCTIFLPTHGVKFNKTHVLLTRFLRIFLTTPHPLAGPKGGMGEFSTSPTWKLSPLASVSRKKRQKICHFRHFFKFLPPIIVFCSLRCPSTIFFFYCRHWPYPHLIWPPRICKVHQIFEHVENKVKVKQWNILNSVSNWTKKFISSLFLYACIWLSLNL